MKLVFAAAAIFLVAAVIVLAGRERIWLLAFGPADLGPVDFSTLALKDTPNQFLMCPPGRCAASPHAPSPIFAVSEQDLRAAIIGSCTDMERTTLVAGTAEAASGEIRLVQYSKWLGFPDTISVQTYPLNANRSTLAVYSRSQVGESDLGVNRRRIEAWLAALPVPSND
jgi:uncharacterized protein (DUF1499 family)